MQELIPIGEADRIPFVLSGGSCEGDEEKLIACNGVELGSAFNACDLFNILHIQCFNASAAFSGVLPLAAGQKPANA